MIAKSRTPRFQVQVNGATMPGLLSLSMTSPLYLQAGTFTVHLAASAPGGPGLAYFADTAAQRVTIQGAADGGALSTLMVGDVDTVSADPIAGIVALEGRDLTHLLIDARIADTYANQTASQVAQTIAARHGLQAQVTATSGLVGRYYQLEHDRLTLSEFARTTTEWDLLKDLAGYVGYQVYVEGTTLYFGPAQTGQAYTLNMSRDQNGVPSIDVVAISLQRSLTLIPHVEVIVQSWNAKQKKGFNRSVTSTGTSESAPIASKNQVYKIVRANLTPDEALQLAQQKLKEITQHERQVTLTMPGETTLTPRNMVSLSGTGTSFDQSYYIAQITRTYDLQHGFAETLHLQNTSPQSSAAVQ